MLPRYRLTAKLKLFERVQNGLCDIHHVKGRIMTRHIILDCARPLL